MNIYQGYKHVKMCDINRIWAIQAPQIDDHIIAYNHIKDKVIGAVCTSTDKSHVIL